MVAARRDIRILDCTLRDGGYINENTFGEENIKSIIKSLQQSRVDLIEYGYIEDKKPITKDKTEFKDFESLFKLTGLERGNILMLLGEKYDVDKLPIAPNDDCYLRISFHKKHAEAGIDKIRRVIEKGYKVFIQPTVTMSYTEDELVELLKECNELCPVSVAIVDTFGQMTPEDVEEKAKIFDGVLDKDIAVSFHAHNNLQNAYANAIRFIESVNEKRKIIVDTSIYGMGRGAGNLPTELIMGYLNQNFGRDYDVEPLLTITDDVISRFKEKNNWGYALPYYLSGIYGVHPSYILTFMERKTLNSRDIKQLVDMISDDKRSEFDLEYAKELYNAYNNKIVDDEDSRKQLTKLIGGRKVLLLGPGKSIRENVDKVKNYIMKEKPFIIGINGEYELGPDAIFFSNKKRYENMELGSKKNTILTTSNIGGVKKGNLVFNYGTYLAKGCGVSDNALLMLLNILKAVKVEKVTVAGFDGYDAKENFYKGSLELLLDKNYVDELNKVIKENITKLRDEMQIESITPSKNI